MRTLSLLLAALALAALTSGCMGVLSDAKVVKDIVRNAPTVAGRQQPSILIKIKGTENRIEFNLRNTELRDSTAPAPAPAPELDAPPAAETESAAEPAKPKADADADATDSARPSPAP